MSFLGLFIYRNMGEGFLTGVWTAVLALMTMPLQLHRWCPTPSLVSLFPSNSQCWSFCLQTSMWQAGTTIHHHTWPGSDRQEVEEREDGNLELRASAPPFQTDNASSELVFLFPHVLLLFSPTASRTITLLWNRSTEEVKLWMNASGNWRMTLNS